jgi:hypothetical protein
VLVLSQLVKLRSLELGGKEEIVSHKLKRCERRGRTCKLSHY